jgi:hypothetical protein
MSRTADGQTEGIMMAPIVHKTSNDQLTMSEDAIVMSYDELRHTIDVEARERMGISGDTFIEKWRQNKLPDTAAASDIGILVRLLDTEPPRSHD